MKFLICLVLTLAVVSAETSWPSINSGYANVHYQPSRRQEVLSEKLQVQENNLGTTQKINGEVEELTEGPDDATEVPDLDGFTAEPQWEQINFPLNNGRPVPEKLTEATETDDLNGDGGVYYIYHPNGLFQKVVYPVDNVEPVQGEVQYVLQPIREPVVTYDPTTFVFQRLIHI